MLRCFALTIVTVLTGSATGLAQTPAPPVARLAATTANLSGGPTSVRIDILAWSTDAVRSQLVDAWNMLPPAPVAGARGASGGARGAPPTAAGGRGARGARGAAPVVSPSAPVPNTPDRSLAQALDSAESVGYVWTSESTGYSLRYAYRLVQPDGSERILLATDRRLGDRDESWKPVSGPASEYDFSVIELRLNGKHEGEGKASVTGKVGVDSSANSIALEGYAGLPVTLKDVRPRVGN
jgi:hypothetical protein